MNELVRIEKRAMSIIHPNTDYQAVLVIQHHSKLCIKLFRAVRSDPSHKLNCLLPPKHECSYNLKKKRIIDTPRTRADRAGEILSGGGGGGGGGGASSGTFLRHNQYYYMCMCIMLL